MCLGTVPAEVFAAGTHDIPEDGATVLEGGTDAPAEELDGEIAPVDDVEAIGTDVPDSRFRMSVRNSERAIAEVEPGSYEVSLEWIGDSKYCTLSDDKTHAEWNFEGTPDMSFVSPSMGQMFDMKLRLKANALDVDAFSLNIPCIQYSKEHTPVEKIGSMGDISAGQFVEFVVDDAAFLQNVIDAGCLSVVKVRDGYRDAYYRVTVKDVEAVSVVLPISMVCQVAKYDTFGRRTVVKTECDYGFLEHVDGSTYSTDIMDGAGRSYMLTANIHKQLSSFSFVRNGQVPEREVLYGQIHWQHVGQARVEQAP